MYNTITGPLELTSLAKALSWTQSKGSYTVKMVDGHPSWPLAEITKEFAGAAKQVLTELALHGLETYSLWQKLVLPQLHRMNIDITSSFYEELETCQIYVTFQPEVHKLIDA